MRPYTGYMSGDPIEAYERWERMTNLLRVVRKLAVKKAEEWMVQRFEASGGLRRTPEEGTLSPEAMTYAALDFRDRCRAAYEPGVKDVS